jgi:hypothetical protein
MDVDVVRHLLAVHLRPEHRILKHQVFRDHAGPQNLASRIDITQIVVDRLDALLEPRAQDVPFGGGQNARQHVEGNEPLLRIGFAVDREGDADAAEQDLGLAPAVVEHVGGHLGEPARQLAIGWPQRPVGARHLVERGRHQTSTLSHARATTRTARDPILAASRAPTQAGISAGPRGPGYRRSAHVLGGR